MTILLKSLNVKSGEWKVQFVACCLGSGRRGEIQRGGGICYIFVKIL